MDNEELILFSLRAIMEHIKYSPSSESRKDINEAIRMIDSVLPKRTDDYGGW